MIIFTFYIPLSFNTPIMKGCARHLKKSTTHLKVDDFVIGRPTIDN